MPEAVKKPVVVRRKPGKPHYRLDKDHAFREILAMMTSMRWITGKSSYDIAAKYKVGINEAQAWAGECSRIIRLGQDKESMRQRILENLDLAARLAVKDKKYGAMRSMLALQADVSGVIEPATIPQSNTSMPIEELRGLLAGLGYDIVKRTEGTLNDPGTSQELGPATSPDPEEEGLVG